MTIIKCPECAGDISSDAAACPQCGKPNKKVADKSKDGRQAAGCALMVAGVGIALIFHPGFGLVILLVGLVYAALNTRFS
jgi:hypothetical protein